jgi:hypothetical protein
LIPLPYFFVQYGFLQSTLSFNHFDFLHPNTKIEHLWHVLNMTQLKHVPLKGEQNCNGAQYTMLVNTKAKVFIFVP